MGIGEIHILPTDKAPDIILDPSGKIKITGRAIDENVRKAPEKVMEWIDSYVNDPADYTEVIIALEYLNSFNTIIMTTILRKLSQVREKSKGLDIRWYIEKDDDDLLDRVESISSAFSMPIELNTVDDIKELY
jgi:hypothetical protein